LNLQTHIPLSKETRHPIDYNSKVLLLGSCFSENIGEKFKYFKFQSNQNPFGILFHPKAIETFITNAINLKEYTEEDVFFLNERWHCFDAHSQMSSTSKDDLLQNLNKAIESTNKQILSVSHIVITLGTSWAYRFIESDLFVANCHKVPQKKFIKELLSIEEITESLASIIALIRDINQNMNFLFTVSPVRHLKDGFAENQLSKSYLISAIHKIIEPREKVFYFPSYEIMMDELRDYRFYNEDMIHPSKTAVNYIWERFSENWISDEANVTLEEVAQIQKDLHHKPFNSKSEEHKKFLAAIQKKMDQLQKKHSEIFF
tara:strand:+ start:2875 stop:3825 length:951 start_codon:yes stop_codon:yes gene_type:complete